MRELLPIKAQTGPNAVKLKSPFHEGTPPCSICRNLGLYEGLEKLSWAEFSVTDLKPDCPGCAVLRAVLVSYDVPMDPDSEYALRPIGRILCLYHKVSSSQPWSCLEFSGDFIETHDASLPLYSVPDISGNTGSSEAVAWIRKQVADCNASLEHASCDPPISLPPYLPSRVLEIVSTTEVRLHLSTQDERGNYICLSHCWGGAQPLKTVKATLETYQRRVPWESLPKSFRESVKLVYDLRLRFIWIDSLCIVQDDIDDWRREGSRMAAIYQSSYLTFSAASASNSSGGLFFVSSPEHRFQKITFEDSDYRILVRSQIECNHQNSVERDQLLTTLPLMTRAWAFQELILAPRIVHFTAHELVWTCPSLARCECSAELSNIFDNYNLSRTNVLRWKGNPPVKWPNVVTAFTERELTYESDIFPALSGLAHFFAQHKQPTYLAGLWQETLVADLMWCSKATTNYRPSKWRAPTWSWTSLVGRIYYPFPGRRSDCNYVTARAVVQPAGIDAFGELLSGTLWLTAPYIKGTIHSNDLCKPDSDEPDSLLRLSSEKSVSDVHYIPDDLSGPNRKVTAAGAIVHVALMDGRFSGSYIPGRSSQLMCLVLLCVDAEKEVYERIGAVLVLRGSDGEYGLGPFEGAEEKTFTVV